MTPRRGVLPSQAVSPTVSHFLAVLLGALSGVGATVLAFFLFDLGADRRIPSAERAFRRMTRRARRMGLTFQEVEHVWSAIDLKGDRLLPLLHEIHREELTLEQGTEVIDRLRIRIQRQEGGPGALPEQVTGWNRSIVGRVSNPVVDAQTRLPGISQPGEHATKEAETPAAGEAALRKERVEAEVKALEAKRAAEATFKGGR